MAPFVIVGLVKLRAVWSWHGSSGILALPVCCVKRTHSRTCLALRLGYNVCMPSKTQNPARKWIAGINPVGLAMLLAALGWVGVIYLVSQVHPSTWWAVAALLAAWAVVLTGTACPVLLALHRRFLGEPTAWTVWRQSAWIGLFGLLAAWLQLNRVLNLSVAVILAGVFVVIELILSWRARQEVQHD